MSVLHKKYRYYSNDEIVNDADMESMVLLIENRFLLPSMLKYIFTIVNMFLLSNTDIFSFCTIIAVVYMFGMIIRLSLPNMIFDILFSCLGVVYHLLRKIWIIPYLSIIILGLLLNKNTLTISFFAISLALFLFENISNIFVRSICMKKYSMPFNDSELCAFSVFYVLLKQDIGRKEFIKNYCKFYKYNHE